MVVCAKMGRFYSGMFEDSGLGRAYGLYRIIWIPRISMPSTRHFWRIRRDRGRNNVINRENIGVAVGTLIAGAILGAVVAAVTGTKRA